MERVPVPLFSMFLLARVEARLAQFQVTSFEATSTRIAEVLPKAMREETSVVAELP
jgi:hypothetical protein